ncbi:sensor histidine kinase [Sphingobium sp. HWE2-09]|uniref:sensor histidine kinase n=1 Tax=Sphingobium sp. HWE2-09 TaxID=3108390 RepID=UPI002DCF47D9|nr:sensor histidine kinase [Sphingobium sp. HWE2-09]
MHTSVLPPIDPMGQLESDHRIANNLNLLAALLELDGGLAEDAGAVGLAEVLHITRRRIYAVANVHRRLYSTDRKGFIDLSSYLEDLGHDLRLVCRDAGGRREISIFADTLYLPARDATSIGILIAELVSNACKHAYPEDKPGEVRIALSTSASGWQLTVEDDGFGFAQSAGRTGARLGAHLIDASAAKLEALYLWEDTNPGTRFTLWRTADGCPQLSATDRVRRVPAGKPRTVEMKPLRNARRGARPPRFRDSDGRDVCR